MVRRAFRRVRRESLLQVAVERGGGADENDNQSDGKPEEGDYSCEIAALLPFRPVPVADEMQRPAGEYDKEQGDDQQETEDLDETPFLHGSPRRGNFTVLAGKKSKSTAVAIERK